MNLPPDTFQKHFESSVDLLCIANTEGFFIKINNAFTQKLGYSEEELLSRPFLDLIHPEDIDATLNEISHLAAGGDTISYKNRYKDANGKYLVLNWSARQDKDSGLIYAIARDSSSLEESIKRTNQIEQALKEKAIFAKTDSRGVITEVNDLFCEISGYSPDELIGKTHKLVNSGYHPKEFFHDMWSTISSGKPWNGVIRNQKKDGNYYFVKTIITPTFDLEGNINSYIAIRSDITESIENAAAFSRTLQILNETSAIAKVGGWELDVATQELTWTDETFKILEVEKKAGQKPVLPEGLELFTDEYQPIIENAVSRAIELGEPYSLEVIARSAKGREFWVYTNGSANYKDGELVSVSGTIQDIHSRKVAELKYVKERQKSIQNSKLASLGELAASMAHEINNPLTAIIGNVELLQLNDHPDENITRKLNSITKSCDRISHIVKSLKKFSRTDESTQHQKRDLHAIVQEAIHLALPKLNNYLIDIQYQQSDPAWIMCDEIEIEQVVLNLINNSVDAISEDTDRWINIEISQNNDLIMLLITDSGNGVPESIQYKLFDPFFTTKATGSGTGLGLSIVRGILEDHGATISYCEDAENTQFKIVFSAADPASDE